jgi:hypothetical protein
MKFLAGAVGDRSNWPNGMILYGFGAYNLADNNKYLAPLMGPIPLFYKTLGEYPLSYSAITLGMKHHGLLFPNH